VSIARPPTLESELARLGLMTLDSVEQIATKGVREWIEENLYIRDKNRQVIPFRFNWAQVDYYEHRTLRDIILKARQLGFTTLISSLFFADCVLRPNTSSVIVAHDWESVERIFRIVRMFWEYLPEDERKRIGAPKYDRKGELFWPRIGSSYYVGTAGSKRFGHGMTIHNLHCSEVSLWTHPEESLVGLLEAVPANGRVVLESTANGVGNHYHDLWVAAKAQQNRFACQFYCWFEDPTYRLDVTKEEAKAWGDQLRALGLAAKS